MKLCGHMDTIPQVDNKKENFSKTLYIIQIISYNENEKIKNFND